jgi:hypothetical protein
MTLPTQRQVATQDVPLDRPPKVAGPNAAFCIGNDSPHLCLVCGQEFLVDSRAPVQACSMCGALEIADCWRLDGRQCPYCKAGVFTADSEFHCVS